MTDYLSLLPGEEFNSSFTYFKKAAEYPLTKTSTDNAAWWCAQLSLLAYSDENKVRVTLANVGLTGELLSAGATQANGSRDDTIHCVVAEDDKNIFFAFRGSPLFTPGDFNDVATLSAKFNQFVHVWFDNAAVVLKEFDAQNPGQKVHTGFLKSWNTIEAKVAAKPRANKRVWLTGHSLGAALATLAASTSLGIEATLVTFGSPRVGNEEFVSKLKIKHLRYVNGGDAITDLPPAISLFNSDYRHHAEPIPLSPVDIPALLARVGVMQTAAAGNFFFDLPKRIFDAMQYFFTASIIDHAPLLYVAQCQKKS